MARRKDSPAKAQTSDSEYYFPPIVQPLADHEVFRLAGELRSDRGTPEQARALIAQFVLQSYTVAGPSRELLIFVRDALAEYLETGKSLDSALRLKKGRRGRPRTTEKRQLEYAIEFLRCRVVLGQSFDDAAESTAESLHTSRTVVCDAFSQHKVKALGALQDARCPVVDMTDPGQRARLATIFDWLAEPADGHATR
jgi:hypothetical protein